MASPLPFTFNYYSDAHIGQIYGVIIYPIVGSVFILLGLAGIIEGSSGLHPWRRSEQTTGGKENKGDSSDHVELLQMDRWQRKGRRTEMLFGSMEDESV